MIGDVCGRVGTLALVCVVSCTTAVARIPAQGGRRLDSGVIAGGGGAGGAVATVGPPAPTEKAAVLARLARLNRSGRFLFGQENATLWGMYLNGGLVSTNTWFETTARAGRFTSDSEAVVGDAPAVLGVSLGMLAFEPPSWNRRRATAEAIRRQNYSKDLRIAFSLAMVPQ